MILVPPIRPSTVLTVNSPKSRLKSISGKYNPMMMA
jgi:hypothetical protein